MDMTSAFSDGRPSTLIGRKPFKYCTKKIQMRKKTAPTGFMDTSSKTLALKERKEKKNNFHQSWFSLWLPPSSLATIPIRANVFPIFMFHFCPSINFATFSIPSVLPLLTFHYLCHYYHFCHISHFCHFYQFCHFFEKFSSQLRGDNISVGEWR